MDPYYALVDLASGNVIEDYEWESEAIAIFSLTYTQSGHPELSAMQDGLVRRVERAMRSNTTQRLSS